MEVQDDITPKVEQFLCMNGGKGDTSYAKNSALQRKVMCSAKHILEQSATELCTTFSSTKCLTIADLGCATGPNALLAVSEIVEIVCKKWHDMVHDNMSPEFLVYLNDLPRNDFNTIFRLMSESHDLFRKDGRKCYVAAMPGSFHGRLFPSQCLHFVHLSYALHWLSQVPDGLIGENGEALNKGNISIGETSSLTVRKAYANQFKKDFRAFLNARSAELISGGNMVLTLIGSPISNDAFKPVEVIGSSLAEMAREGLINEHKLDKFNMPLHVASEEQIKEVIFKEGHFSIRRVEIIKTGWDAGMEEDDKSGHGRHGRGRGEFVAKYMRAVVEPLLIAAFGEAIMDELFMRVSARFSETMEAEDCNYHNIVVWLTRV